MFRAPLLLSSLLLLVTQGCNKELVESEPGAAPSPSPSVKAVDNPATPPVDKQDACRDTCMPRGDFEGCLDKCENLTPQEFACWEARIDCYQECKVPCPDSPGSKGGCGMDEACRRNCQARAGCEPD